MRKIEYMEGVYHVPERKEGSEWIPDENNQYETSEESFAFAREFTKFRGEYPLGEKFRWESLSHMRKRMIHVADKYSDYDKVILGGHGVVFRCITYIKKCILLK